MHDVENIISKYGNQIKRADANEMFGLGFKSPLLIVHLSFLHVEKMVLKESI
jgi:hypothetical protein